MIKVTERYIHFLCDCEEPVMYKLIISLMERTPYVMILSEDQLADFESELSDYSSGSYDYVTMVTAESDTEIFCYLAHRILGYTASVIQEEK